METHKLEFPDFLFFKHFLSRDLSNKTTYRWKNLGVRQQAWDSFAQGSSAKGWEHTTYQAEPWTQISQKAECCPIPHQGRRHTHTWFYDQHLASFGSSYLLQPLDISLGFLKTFLNTEIKNQKIRELCLFQLNCSFNSAYSRNIFTPKPKTGVMQNLDSDVPEELFRCQKGWQRSTKRALLCGRTMEWIGKREKMLLNVNDFSVASYLRWLHSFLMPLVLNSLFFVPQLYITSQIWTPASRT